jgi:phosphopantetheinyl transferase
MLVNSIYLFPIDTTYQYLDCLDITIPNRIREKALRFYKLSDQNNYLAARWILYSLTQNAGLNVSFGDFKISANGKPFIPGFSSFNISHCNGMVAVALSGGDIGIDVEHFDASRSLDHFRDVFSTQEIRAIEQYGKKAFYYFWTLKEAVLKYTGEWLAKLSTIQQISSKYENHVLHNNNNFHYSSFTFNDLYFISCVTSFQDGNFQPFKFFNCVLDNNNKLLIEENENLLDKFQFT